MNNAAFIEVEPKPETAANPYNAIAKPPAEKFVTVQFFRFLAAFIVIIYHATYYTADRLDKGLNQYQTGHNGVVLFFVISGFVMIISSEKLIGKNDGWRIFMMRRLLRIVPIYWLVTSYKAIVMLFSTKLVKHAHLDTLTLIKSYLFIPARNIDGSFRPLLGVGWTLNFEMFFYVCFAIALALKIRPIAFLSIIFTPLVVLGFYRTESWSDLSFYTDPIIINFLLGLVAAKLVVMNVKLPQYPAIIILLISMVILVFPKSIILPALLGSETVYLMLVSVVCFLIIYSTASAEKYLSVFVPSWVVFLGGASYSLYLIHPLIAPIAPAVLKAIKMPLPWLSITGAIIASLICGTLFYYFFENSITNFFLKRAKKRNLI